MEDLHTKDTTWGKDGATVEVAQGKISPQYEKEFFYCENNHWLEQPPQLCGRNPVTGGVQDALGQGNRWCHLGFLPVEGCIRRYPRFLLFHDFIVLLTQRKVSLSSVPTEAKDTKIHFSFETKSNKQDIMWLSSSEQNSINQTCLILSAYWI